MTDLPDIYLTVHALVEPLHPVIRSPFHLLLFCVSLFFPLCSWAVMTSVLLAECTVISWISEFAQWATGCEKFSGMLYILMLRALMAMCRTRLPMHPLNNEDPHSNHIRIRRNRSSRKGIIENHPQQRYFWCKPDRQTEPHLSTCRTRSPRTCYLALISSQVVLLQPCSILSPLRTPYAVPTPI